jgi:hypothetical protein
MGYDTSYGVSLGTARCHYATPLALKVFLNDLHRVIWVPRSVIHDDSEVWQLGDSGDLCVHQWWAEESGFD